MELSKAGKKFSKEWVFRNLSTTLNSSQPTAILGSNGSGKSTLITSILGFQTLTEGELKVFKTQIPVAIEDVYKLAAFAAPYLLLYEDFTLYETIQFHVKLKPFFSEISIDEEIKEANLWESRHKPLKKFSSGMKQRVKLMLAIFSDTPILLLDEPTANLDKVGVKWFQKKLEAWADDRVVVVASNYIESEIFMCTNQLLIEDFKL